MRRAEVFMHGKKAGVLEEETPGRSYRFAYLEQYNGPPLSVSMPVDGDSYRFDRFPAFFEGLLPQGTNLDLLIEEKQLAADDQFAQLMAVGLDTVGAVTLRRVEE